MLTSIEGRSVIVTGASKGIGKGIARVFASRGARVLIAARNLSQAEAAAAEIQSSGGLVSAVAVDVSKMEDNVRMAQTAIDRHGGIDILCCNAGIFPAAKLFDMSEADWDQVLDINLKGTFLSVQACLPGSKLGEKDVSWLRLRSPVRSPVTRAGATTEPAKPGNWVLSALRRLSLLPSTSP